MNDRMILTPYFLDEYDPIIAALAGDDWRVVTPDLPNGDQLARLSAIHRALAAEVRAALALSLIHIFRPFTHRHHDRILVHGKLLFLVKL